MDDLSRGIDTLALQCQRALSRAVRNHGIGSRQQARAAARSFVRHHRRDAGYLTWVLRSTSVCSAFAVTLLGLSAAPASAELAPYAALTGAANPLAGVDLGDRSRPALGDLDGDGDLDLLAGELTGIFAYFENTGSATVAAFVARTGAANPLDGHDLGDRSTPALCDLDGDGDLDVVAGEYLGTLAYFENTGSAVSPAFTPRTGAANPLDGMVAGYSVVPALGDLDGDGDLDLFVGEAYGHFAYFENTGSATSPVFIPRAGPDNPLHEYSFHGNASPVIGDIDGDGDLDVVGGNRDGNLFPFENTGTATSPSFVIHLGDANPFKGQDVGTHASPAMGDLDGDGDPDVIAGAIDGAFFSYEHLGGRFVPRNGTFNPLAAEDLGSHASPALRDLDGDGDLDLVAGEFYGTFVYFQNTGSATSPLFVQRTGLANPLYGRDPGYLSAPTFGDLDGDGDLDLITGDDYGAFSYFRNTGSATSPAFALATGAADPLNGQSVASPSTPTLGDLDGDGDLDLVVGGGSEALAYFENTGTPANPAFIARTGAQNPLDGQGHGSAPSLDDVDRDGDLDLVAGESLGTFAYFENTGGATSPVFVARTGNANPLHGSNVGTDPRAALGDLDGDGDLDLLAGEIDGTFSTFESLIPQPLPAFELTNGANPLGGMDAGDFSAPAIGDLDADGDLDVVAGASEGTFASFANTGTATDPVFTALAGAGDPLGGQDVGSSARPSLADLDDDGDFDLVAGEALGTFLYFENSGSATSPVFALRTGVADPLAGLTVVVDAAPSLGDLDGDGDLDLVAGAGAGTFHIFENTGNATSPVFVERTGAANPLDGQSVGARSVPVLFDFDGDGDLDLVAGQDDGTLDYFKNQGSASSPAFVRLPDEANPFCGSDVGDSSAPAAGDLRGDGDPELATGSSDGELHVQYFPEPARGVLLGAGIGVAVLLERLRRRL